MKIEQRRKLECETANCHLDKSRCLVKFGLMCIKNGGTRIPVQSATVKESIPQIIEAQTTFKPYFIVDGKTDYEGREY